MRIKFVNIESASYCEADRISHLCGKPRSFVTVVISIGAIAFALRFAVGWYLGAADFWESGYSFFFTFAKSIASGKGFALADGFPTASRVPLYPIFLAAVTGGHRAFLPLLLAQSLVGAGTVCCAAILAQELFSKRAAVIAAIITALYPYYVVHDTALQETGLYTFLAILSVVMLTRAHRSRSVFQAIISGLALGASVLTRANLAPFAFVAPVWLAVSPNSGPMFCRRRIPMAILCAATLAATVAPWLARSYWLTGTSTLSTQTGFFLWLGNNPLTFSHYPLESIDLSQKVAMATLSSDDLAQLAARGTEAAEDNWFLNKGLDYMREYPLRTILNDLRKIGATFGWLPSPRGSFLQNMVHMFSYGPIMLLGLWGMWSTRSHWRSYLLIYAQFVSFCMVTAVFFGHTSYRSYLDVYWIIFAAATLDRFPWSWDWGSTRSVQANDEQRDISHLEHDLEKLQTFPTRSCVETMR